MHSYAFSSTSLGCNIALPGTESRRCSQTVPATYREPLCPPRVLLEAERGQPRLGRRYPALFARIGSCAPPKSSLRLSSRLYGESLQVAASLLLEVGGSQRYPHNPCIGAWPHTPPRSLGALTRFFPRDIGLTSRIIRSAHEIFPYNATSTGFIFSGLQTFHYVQAPMLARPPDCTHRCGSMSAGQPGRLLHAMNLGLLPGAVVSLRA